MRRKIGNNRLIGCIEENMRIGCIWGNMSFGRRSMKTVCILRCMRIGCSNLIESIDMRIGCNTKIGYIEETEAILLKQS